MSEVERTVEEADSADLSSVDLSEIRRLVETAFGERFTEEDWRHAVGGRHFFTRGSEGAIVSHAAVVSRTLEVSGYQLSTGYVEAVATHPEWRRVGLATAIMRSVAEFVQEHFQIGALSGDPGFYEKLGWVRWRGSTWCRDGECLYRTTDDDGGVLVLPTRFGRDLDFEGDIVAQWRDGDTW